MVKDSRIKIFIEILILFLFVFISTNYAAIPNAQPKLLMPMDIEFSKKNNKELKTIKKKSSLSALMLQGKCYQKLNNSISDKRSCAHSL